MHHRLIRVWLGVSLVAVALTGPSAPAQTPALPADLAIVHPDALGFVHVRLAELWKHEALTVARDMAAETGPEFLDLLDKQFVPKPSTAERFTVILLAPDPDIDRGDYSVVGPRDPQPIGILRFTEPFDVTAAAKSVFPVPAKKTAGGRDYFTDGYGMFAVHFPDDRTIAFAPAQTFASYLTWAPKAEGGLAPAIELARSGSSPVVAAVNRATFPVPPDVWDDLPADVRPLARARLAVATLGLDDRPTLTMKLTFDDARSAADGAAALRAAAGIARSFLAEQRKEAAEALRSGVRPDGDARPLADLPHAMYVAAAIGAMKVADRHLADLPVERAGAELVTAIRFPTWTAEYIGTAAVATGLTVPILQNMFNNFVHERAMKHLKDIGLALYSYESSHGRFPAAASVDKKTGAKLLSWRVHVLPYFGYEWLYGQFKLDEPWDSEHNKKLIPRMPYEYQNVLLPARPGETYTKAFVGKDTALLDSGVGRKLTTFKDGSSNTIAIVAGAGDPVIWTKPEDIPFDSAKPIPRITIPLGYLMALFADGSIRSHVRREFVESDGFRAAITASGGDIVDGW